MHRRMTTTAPTTTERQLEDALRAALAGTGPAGVLVLGPSGAGKTALVRACLARLGCSRVEYSGALTLRNRAYFESFESQQRGGGGSGGCILDLLRAASHQQQQQQQLSAATTPLLLPPTALAEPLVLVVDDMDTLANDAGHGLDGLQRLLPLPPPSHHQSSSSSSSSSHHRVVAVCIATGRHKSDKRLMDLYRRCTEVRVSAPAVWDASRGGAAAAPGRAAGERALYPLVHSLLSRALPAGAVAAAGLSEPDRAAVGLLVHENLHEYCGAAASDAALAAVARDHATADAVSTLPHQAQTWHQWELGFALRALRPNRRLFHNNDDNGDNGIKGDGARTRVPVFTKLLTRCSTESGTRAFLTDMCFRLGCSWRELFPMLTRLDAEFSALIARPTPPPLLACLRQAGAGARRGPAAAAAAAEVSSSSVLSTEAAPLAPTQQQQRSRATVAGTAARFDWLHLRLSSMLVSSAQARYLPRLALSDVRRMYRCLRAESAQGARVNRRSEAAAAAAAANAAAARKGGQERRRPKKDGEDDDDDDVNDDDAVDEDFGDEGGGGGGGENEDEEEEEDGADCDDDGADDDSDGGVVRKRRRRRE